jgi:hypothetical protein
MMGKLRKIGNVILMDDNKTCGQFKKINDVILFCHETKAKIEKMGLDL